MPVDRASRLPALLLAVLSVLLAVPVLAAIKLEPWQRDYLEGRTHFEVGEYSEAARRLRSAIAVQPQEALSKFKSSNYVTEDYLPHFYLGLTLEKLGQREAALAAVKESERQGAVKGRASVASLLTIVLTRLEPPRVAEVREVRPPPTATPAPQPTPTPVPALPTATPVPAAPTVARPQVGGLPAATATPSRAPTSTPVPLPTLPSEERAAVLEGVRSFFKGDYREAVRHLDRVKGTSPVARAFLAYALVSEELLAEKPSIENVARAREEFAAASAEGAPRPDGRISPSVLKLLVSEK